MKLVITVEKLDEEKIVPVQDMKGITVNGRINLLI